MALQLLVPKGRDTPRAEPVSGVLYRCAAAWQICPFCAVPLRDVAALNRCAGCKTLLPAEPVLSACSMYGVVELRDLEGGFHGLLCQGHARAVMSQVPGAKLLVKASNLADLLEERIGVLFAFPPPLACMCLPGESRIGPNEFGDIHCDTCGRLMIASTMSHLSELLIEIRQNEDQREEAHDH